MESGGGVQSRIRGIDPASNASAARNICIIAYHREIPIRGTGQDIEALK